METTQTPMLSIYLAARYSRRDELRSVAAKLRSLGYDITSRWLNEDFPLNISLKDVCPRDKMAIALNDLNDIRAADVMIFFAEPADQQPPRGGRHVEFGIAHALGKYIIAIGEHENVFHYLPGVMNVPTVEASLPILKERQGRH